MELLMPLLKPEAIAFFKKGFSSVFCFKLMKMLNYISWCCCWVFLGRVLVVTHLFTKFL